MAKPTFGTSIVPASAPPRRRMLHRKDLPDKGICFHPNHLRRMIANGDFPKPVRLSERIVAWPEDVVDAWIDSKIAESA